MPPRSRQLSPSPSSSMSPGDEEESAKLLDNVYFDDDEAAPASKETEPLHYAHTASRFLHLFFFPALFLLLSFQMTSRFVTMFLVFLAASVRPVLYYVRGKFCKARGLSIDFQDSVFDDLVYTTVQMQRSMAVQFSVLILFLFIYFKTSQNCGGDKNVHAAYSNAHSIIGTEHLLGIDLEPRLQMLLLPHTYILTFFNQYYSRMHFVVPIATAGWLLVTGKDERYRQRSAFAWTLVLALFGYWFIPTMPPRLLSRYAYTYIEDHATESEEWMKPWYDMVDTLRESKSTYDKLHAAHGNPYAAMPSMHTGWAFWSAWAVWRHTGNVASKRIWRSVATAHVFVIMFATIVTANHYILDLLAGIFCVLCGHGLTNLSLYLWDVTHPSAPMPTQGSVSPKEIGIVIV